MYKMQKDSLVDVNKGKRKRLEESSLLILYTIKYIKAAIKVYKGYYY